MPPPAASEPLREAMTYTHVLVDMSHYMYVDVTREVVLMSPVERQ